MDEVRKEHPSVSAYTLAVFAAQRAIDQCEATEQELHDFRQEVSDTVVSLCNTTLAGHSHHRVREMLSRRFIIPTVEPDPLVAALEGVTFDHYPPNDAKTIRAALDALGFEIREKGQ